MNAGFGRAGTGPYLVTRLRILAIAALWIAAIAAFLLQYRAFERVVAAEWFERDFDVVARSPAWTLLWVLVPFSLIAGAFLLQLRWSRGPWRWVAWVSLLVPAAAAVSMLAVLRTPYAIDTVTVEDGRTYILAVDTITYYTSDGPDRVLIVYRPDGPFGLYWREAGNLNSPEVGSFGGPSRLALSPDGRWLLVRRGGIWTDCFRVTPRALADCGLGPRIGSDDSGFEQKIRARARRIAQLTAMAPK